MRGPNKQDRWRAALDERNIKRQEIRQKAFGGTSLGKGTVPAVAPEDQMMVKRGTRVMPLSHQQATNTTAKSWAARKQKFGRVGRQSKNTFQKKK